LLLARLWLRLADRLNPKNPQPGLSDKLQAPTIKREVEEDRGTVKRSPVAGAKGDSPSKIN
jgi:hypothetical protein